MDAAPQLLAGKLSKPAFDLIDPRCCAELQFQMTSSLGAIEDRIAVTDPAYSTSQ
jgi:hypothetical protein